MKKLILFLVCIGFSYQLFADSPLTSTEISRAYFDVPIVVKASKAKGELTVELMKYLKNKGNPIAVKIAIINELGLNAIGSFVDENSDFDSLQEGAYRKDNASIFYEYLNKKKKYTTNKEFLNQSNGDELICMAYFKAMDNYDVLDEALLFAKKAKIKNPKSYTTQIICALIEAQQAMSTDWCLVYTITNNVRTNKDLNKDLNAEAISIIFEYMDLYKNDCKTKTTQENSMKNYKKTISRNEAIQIAKNDVNRGILGTWIDYSLKNGNWHISSYSKSANPPKYYVINSENGEILLRLDNTDNPNQKEKLKVYLKNTQESAMKDYKKAIELAEALMIKNEFVLEEYNLVKLQNQFLYGKDEGMASSVWEIIYKTKNTVDEDEYRLRGGEVIIEVDLKTQIAKITGWGE